MSDLVYFCVTVQSLMLMVLAIGLCLAMKRLESSIDRLQAMLMKNVCSSAPMSARSLQLCDEGFDEKSGT